ncbi:rhamnogalacturonate lyase B-like [Manihot esculenta]|uniref:rhamnogalacturonate lyase B-like n=1 Tax=Manihot esculenta TaxID=3983 RepID=UPI001CC78F18|nr:rhamnogalacturonate lyase B-like [Manihot esculenta]
MGKMHLLVGSSWPAIVLCFFFFFFIASSANIPARKVPSRTNNNPALGVQLQVTDKQVVVDNGIVQVTFSNPGGDVIGIKYKTIDNALEIKNKEDNRGYWDVVWNRPGESNIFDKLQATKFSIIVQNNDRVEISFSKIWSPSMDKTIVPLKVDKRYIVQRGSSGLYLYAIMERLKGWPDVDMDQIRVVFKLQSKKFHYMAISDDRQREMPMPQDRVTGQPLAFPEAVRLTNPVNPKQKGEVDDKYQYSCENKDNKVHGWISNDPPVGFWMITPSNEFRDAGPVKQDLTSHVGPIVLNMFGSVHYAGKDLNAAYRNGEPWKKVFGPVFVYLNSVPSVNPKALWEDAKRQMSTEVKSWPYNFPRSQDFPSSGQRGNVVGRLVVREQYINKRSMDASFAYVGLAAPGVAGSWQTEAKGYQFWTQADKKGSFSIKNIRAGKYSLYAFVPGFIGDYKYNVDIIIQPGSNIKLGVLTYDPPRNGPTLWEIGIPDRTAAEFYIPDPNPTLINKLYINSPANKFRQYGLWDRYTDLYPKNDLIYTVGVSNYAKDWFYAHVNRRVGNMAYEATTWQIIFELKSAKLSGSYTLQIALASATNSELQVRFNNAKAKRPLFTTRLIGRDNAIARMGIHGLYWLYSIQVPSTQLLQGKNIIYLTQSRKGSPFNGIMYDYIRLEAPPPSNSTPLS